MTGKGEIRLRRRKQKEGSAIVTYSVLLMDKNPPLSLHRVQWYPKLKTWRIMEMRRIANNAGRRYWGQIVHAELGNLSEEEMIPLALATLNLLGY